MEMNSIRLMSASTPLAGSNVIPFPRRQPTEPRPSDRSFLTEYERLVRAFIRIRNPKTRGLIIALLEASETRLPFADSGP